MEWVNTIKKIKTWSFAIRPEMHQGILPTSDNIGDYAKIVSLAID